jgi:uncharacterized protein involved in response to NO
MAATKHYESYPEGNIPVYLAYGFRPAFLLMAPYMILSIVLWGLYYSGYIALPWIGDTLSWHIYEMLFGVGFLGMAAFIFTGAPELYPGTIPVVGKTLRNLIPTSTPNFSKTLIPRATLKPSLPKINLPVPHLLC